MQGAIVMVTALAAVCIGEPILQAPRLGAIYKGPDSETIIAGPDGSIIRAAAEGGSVDTSGGPTLGGPVIVAAEPDAEVLPFAVAPPTLLVQHDPIIVSSPSPLIHEVSNTFIAPGHFVTNGHESSATVVASSGLGSSASASFSSAGGAVVAHANVSPARFAVAPVVQEVVSVVQPVAVVAAPARRVIALEEPAPIIPIPEPPSVEVRHADTALIGPSGTISTKGGSATINGPASITVSNNGVVSEAIKLDVVSAPAPPVHAFVETRPIVTEPLRETFVVSTPKPVVFVQDVDPTRIDLGPQRFITETLVPQARETVIISASPAPIVEPSYETVHNVAAFEKERYIAQSFAPPRGVHDGFVRTAPGPAEFVASNQRFVAENVRRDHVITAAVPQYAEPTPYGHHYQRSAGPNIPFHPPVNSVPAAILDRHATYSTSVVSRTPHL